MERSFFMRNSAAMMEMRMYMSMGMCMCFCAVVSYGDSDPHR